MKKTILVVIGASLCASAAAARRPMTIDDVIALRQAFDVQFSPDGSRLAFVVREWDRTHDRFIADIHAVDVVSGNVTRLTNTPERDRSPRWNPRAGELAFLSEVDGRVQVHVLDAGTRQRRVLFRHGSSISAFRWHPDGASVVFIAPDPEPPGSESRSTKPVMLIGEDDPLSRLWLYDGTTRQVMPLTDGKSHVVGAEVSPDGTAVAFTSEPSPRWPDFMQREVFVMPLTGGSPRVMTSNAVAESMLRWSPDGTRLSWLAATDGNVLGVGPQRVHVVPAAGGAARVLAPAFDGYIEQYEWAADGKTLVIAAGVGVARRIYRLPLGDGPLEPITEGDGAFGPFAMSKQGRIAYLHQTPDRPGDLWIKTDARDAPRRLTDLNPQAQEWALGKVETIRWKSDGLEIEGLVVYPLDYQPGKRYPLILQIHGGPESAHTRSFMADWGNDPHVYAAAGYVTFLPNFRSSSNYGARFAQGAGANSAAAEDGVFGDLMTGLDALIEKGVADPARLAIKGWSYGGYMTSWVIGHSQRFKVAAYGAGDTNLVSYYGTASINPGFDILNEAPYDNFAKWIERSPLMSVAKVKTPCLIFQGEKDTIVPLGQSLEFHKALKHFGVPTRLVVYPGEAHGLSEPSYMRDKMQREFEWFEKYLKQPAGSY